MELALKGVLRAVGVEVPHVHDIGVFLREQTANLPPTFAKHLDRLVSISRALRKERELSFCGDEALGAPPEQLYARIDADRAVDDARFVVELCSELLAAQGA